MDLQLCHMKQLALVFLIATPSDKYAYKVDNQLTCSCGYQNHAAQFQTHFALLIPNKNWDI